MHRVTRVGFIVIFLLSLSGCATMTGAPVLRVDTAGAKFQGRWVDPQKDPLLAFDKVERGKTTYAELRGLGFDSDAEIMGGEIHAKNAREAETAEKKARDVRVSKPTKLEGPDAYKLYMQMLGFDTGTQVITQELIEKRQAEVGRYTAYVFKIENVQEKKDRIYFSNYKKTKFGYSYEFRFVLKDGVVVEKTKVEQDFNEETTERSFGKGAVEVLQGIKGVIPIPFIP